jgi:hypothetical protein
LDFRKDEVRGVFSRGQGEEECTSRGWGRISLNLQDEAERILAKSFLKESSAERFSAMSQSLRNEVMRKMEIHFRGIHRYRIYALACSSAGVGVSKKIFKRPERGF